MINIEKGLIDFKVNRILFKASVMSLEADGVNLKIADSEMLVKKRDSGLILKCEFPKKNISWEINIKDKTDEKIIETNITNNGSKPVKLGKASLLDSGIENFMSDDDGTTVLPWQPVCNQNVYRINDPKMPEKSKIKIQFSNNTRKAALQVAFLSFQRCDTELIIKRVGKSFNGLQASCNFAGWELQPGQSCSTEVLRIVAGENPFRQLENWADTINEMIKPDIWKDAPLGYLGWSWTDTVNGAENYEKVVLENLDAINSKLDGFGFKYLWTSMSNFEGSLPGNWLKWNYDCIPCGRETFIKSVKQKGFMSGFWIGPFYFCSNLKELMQELGDAILKTSEGERMVVCQEWRHGDAGKIPKKDRPCLYALDPSHPKTLAFMKKVFSTYRKWGVRYYMLDFLEAGAGNISRFPYGNHFDRKLVAGPEVYTNFLRMMRKSTGKDTYLLSSTGPNVHNAGMLDGIRVGNDFGEGRSISQEAFFYPASYIINNCDFWTGPKYALNCQAASYHTHRKLYINDSGNVLTVDKPIPLSHARINATIHAFSGGPTMLGDDMRHISAERLALIKKTVPRSKDVAFPVDLFTSPTPDYSRIFLRSIKTDWSEYKVIAVYNLKPLPEKVNISFDDLDLKKGSSYLVWDFWNEMFIGKKIDSFGVHVPQESVTVLRLLKDSKQPAILGTDMHLMMGEMEIRHFEYDPVKMKCSFAAERPKGESGMVFLHVPENMYVRNIDGLHIAKDSPSNALVIGVPLLFSKKTVKKEISFGWIEKPVDMKKENFA